MLDFDADEWALQGNRYRCPHGCGHAGGKSQQERHEAELLRDSQQSEHRCKGAALSRWPSEEIFGLFVTGQHTVGPFTQFRIRLDSRGAPGFCARSLDFLLITPSTYFFEPQEVRTSKSVETSDLRKRACETHQFSGVASSAAWMTSARLSQLLI